MLFVPHRRERNGETKGLERQKERKKKRGREAKSPDEQ
jgi:hypothetical protein